MWPSVAYILGQLSLVASREVTERIRDFVTVHMVEKVVIIGAIAEAGEEDTVEGGDAVEAEEGSYVRRSLSIL